MYGNDTLPGVAVSETYRSKESIWQGAPEATWFKSVNVNGSESEGMPISAGTIMKELTADGSYAPIVVDDIITAVSGLPGVRLAIVADKTAKTGITTMTKNDDNEDVEVSIPSSVLVGTCGKVDKAKLLIGDTAFEKLTAAQQISLNTQLEAWGFMLVSVLQA